METMARWVHRTKKHVDFPSQTVFHDHMVSICRVFGGAGVHPFIVLYPWEFRVRTWGIGIGDNFDPNQYEPTTGWWHFWDFFSFVFFFTTTIFQWTPIDGRAKKGLHLSNRWGRWMAWYHDRKTCSPKRKLQEVKCASTLLSASYTSAIFISYKSQVFFSCFVG